LQVHRNGDSGSPLRRWFNQRLEIRDQYRVLDNRWLAPLPDPIRWFVLRQFLQPPMSEGLDLAAADAIAVATLEHSVGSVG
jgi:hypothetical protein